MAVKIAELVASLMDPMVPMSEVNRKFDDIVARK